MYLSLSLLIIVAVVPHEIIIAVSFNVTVVWRPLKVPRPTCPRQRRPLRWAYVLLNVMTMFVVEFQMVSEEKRSRLS